MRIDVDEKIRQLNELRHEYSDDVANDLVRGWLKEMVPAEQHQQALSVLDDLITAVNDFGLIIDYCQSCGKTLVTVDTGETPYCERCSAN